MRPWALDGALLCNSCAKTFKANFQGFGVNRRVQNSFSRSRFFYFGNLVSALFLGNLTEWREFARIWLDRGLLRGASLFFQKLENGVMAETKAILRSQKFYGCDRQFTANVFPHFLRCAVDGRANPGIEPLEPAAMALFALTQKSLGG